MTHFTLLELQNYIDELVGPLPARPDRKRLIRDELLAHLLAIYDEEYIQLGDERAALCRATQRFGNYGDLFDDLRTSLPLLERTIFLLANRKGNTMWRWLVPLGCVAVLVGLGFVFPAIADLRNHGEALGISLVLLTLGSVVTLGGVGSVAYGIKVFRTP